jgi:HD-GYP domain-containing protein (c-di-GMP phosphodiesterase class II)
VAVARDAPRIGDALPVTPRLRLAELLVGLSRVADMGMGLEPGEAARACLIAARLAAALGVPEPSDVYYTTLLQHVGCTAYAHEAARRFGGDEIAVKAAALRADPAAGDAAVAAAYSRANCEVAAMTARRVGLGAGVQAGLRDIFEHWDGTGAPRGAAGEAIALPARVAQVAATASLFDGLGGPEGAVLTVRRRAGTSLDPQVAAAFCERADALLGELAAADALHAAVAAEPAPAVLVAEPSLDAVCRAFGEAVDLKSPFHHGHSTGVAALAAAAAERLGLPAADVRRSALLHDLGRAAVPNGIWERQGALSTGDWERVRLHAYHGERVLSGCGPLAPLATLAGMHHERLDGSGYHRQATAAAIPLPARVLAAADAYQAMTQARAHRPAREPQAAAAELAATPGLDGDAVAAVLAAAGQPAPRRAPAPAGLTDRQLQVLRLVAKGLSNPEIARRLVVSRRTAEHHVQDVYAKIGVASRAGAALFAMEHDLLG